jgi:hypothetical protein
VRFGVGKLKGLYNPEYPKGTKVRIASPDRLTEFFYNWKLHNRLEPAQLEYAGVVAEVLAVGFYHGADELYKLKGVPGIRHEICLQPVEAEGVPREVSQ